MPSLHFLEKIQRGITNEQGHRSIGNDRTSLLRTNGNVYLLIQMGKKRTFFPNADNCDACVRERPRVIINNRPTPSNGKTSIGVARYIRKLDLDLIAL